MVNRTEPDLSVEVAFTKSEVQILNQLAKGTKPSFPATVSDYITEVAKLGGYLARGKDPPPGNMVLWRGLSRLTDIQIGFELRKGVVGN